jgi:hypothetical protein
MTKVYSRRPGEADAGLPGVEVKPKPAAARAPPHKPPRPLVDTFVKDVQNLYDMAQAQGIPVCPAEKIGMAVTPCADGITPVEWPGQDHQVCTPAPAGCPL